MASSVPLIVFLLLVLLSLTSGCSLFTRDAATKQADESADVMATRISDHQGSSMIHAEDLVKARRLQARVAGSKVVVNEAVSKSISSTKKKSKSRSSTSKKDSKKKHKSKIGPLDVSALVAIIIAVIVVIIVIIFIIYCLTHKTKKRVLNKTSRTEDHV